MRRPRIEPGGDARVTQVQEGDGTCNRGREQRRHAAQVCGDRLVIPRQLHQASASADAWWTTTHVRKDCFPSLSDGTVIKNPRWPWHLRWHPCGVWIKVHRPLSQHSRPHSGGHYSSSELLRSSDRSLLTTGCRSVLRHDFQHKATTAIAKTVRLDRSRGA